MKNQRTKKNSFEINADGIIWNNSQNNLDTKYIKKIEIQIKSQQFMLSKTINTSVTSSLWVDKKTSDDKFDYVVYVLCLKKIF